MRLVKKLLKDLWFPTRNFGGGYPCCCEETSQSSSSSSTSFSYSSFSVDIDCNGCRTAVPTYIDVTFPSFTNTDSGICSLGCNDNNVFRCYFDAARTVATVFVDDCIYSYERGASGDPDNLTILVILRESPVFTGKLLIGVQVFSTPACFNYIGSLIYEPPDYDPFLKPTCEGIDFDITLSPLSTPICTTSDPFHIKAYYV